MKEEPAFEIGELILKYLRDELTPQEGHALEAWKQSSPHNQALFEELTSDVLLTQELTVFQGIDKEEGRKKLHRSIPKGTVKRMPRWWKYVAAAAAVVLVSMGVYYFAIRGTQVENTVAKEKPILPNDVAPPSTVTAILTLSNGKKIVLDSAGKGTLARQEQVDIVKLADGQIAYSRPSSLSYQEVVYNTLTNPRGSKVINMKLSDGSQVWLNAGSSLRYPVAFVGKERNVEITGEAYFEVSHDAAKPFIVSKGSMRVQVLGTHFNVNAYEDEPNVKVTLLKGSVEVKTLGAKIKIKPGQQAVVGNTLTVAPDVDLEEVMAWKNGLFQFNRTDIRTIMRQLERWYNVEVVYQTDVPNKDFTGGLPRGENISQVLKMLEATGAIHFEIQDKKIIVKD